MLLKLLNVVGIVILAITTSTKVFAEGSPGSDINTELLAAMQAYHVPVVGYAIIDNYKIVAADTLSIDKNLQVSTHSLFQAASISKSVTAFGALKLLSQGKLKLDEDVNRVLKTWQIPVNRYNQQHPVTLRQLMDMTSGLSVSGFPGHVQGQPLPTLIEVLNGQPPANTPPVKPFYTPGSRYFYSGGAFQVLEQLIEDTTKQRFQSWMQTEILKPLNMTNSLFEFPLSKDKRSTAIPGFMLDGSMVKGGWNNYAIAGAGGLWSTPTDIAKFAIGVANAYTGKDKTIISSSIAKQLLTRQPNTDYGFGVVVNGSGKTLNFRKAGHNTGYHNEMLMFANTGQGIVIMTNSENGEYIINYIIPVIAKKYHWPCYFPFFDELLEIPKYAC